MRTGTILYYSIRIARLRIFVPILIPCRLNIDMRLATRQSDKSVSTFSSPAPRQIGYWFLLLWFDPGANTGQHLIGFYAALTLSSRATILRNAHDGGLLFRIQALSTRADQITRHAVTTAGNKELFIYLFIYLFIWKQNNRRTRRSLILQLNINIVLCLGVSYIIDGGH